MTSSLRIPALLLALSSLAMARTDQTEYAGPPNMSVPTKLSGDLDPKRIINESYNFLRNREPEMTAAEYALYEKVSGMISVQPDFAITLLEAMMNEKEKPSPAFALMLGNAYYAAKNNAKAEFYYKQSVERSPEFLRAWGNLAVLYYGREDYTEAARCFAKSVSLGDRSPATFGLLGYCLERQGNEVGAEAAYLQALAGDITQTDWTEGLLRIYINGKQFARAESLIRQLIQFKPNEGRHWLTLANVLLGQGKRFEAMAALDTQVSLGIADTQSRLLLGDLYAERRLVPEAIATYTGLRAEESKLGVDRLLTFADLLTGAGDFERAAGVLTAAEKLSGPESAGKVRLARADLLVARGEIPAACRLLEEHIEKAPLDGKAMLALARALGRSGDTARAAILLEHATHIPNSTYPACLELANLELKLQHYERSLQFATMALALERTPPLEQFIAQVKALLEAQTPQS